MAVAAEPASVTDPEIDAGEAPHVQRRPSPEQATSAVTSALREGRVVSLVGRCDVERGDVGPAGDRLLLLKPDGAGAVHGAGGSAPERRLSGIEEDDVVAAADGIRIVPERGPPVELSDVQLVTVVTLGEEDDDDGNGHGAIRERMLADPDLLEPGFRPLATERETSAGPVDVYGRDADGRHVVVEIKALRAGPAAVGQLDRYVEALGRDLHADAEVQGFLVAPSATDRARRLLGDRGYEFRRLDSG